MRIVAQAALLWAAGMGCAPGSESDTPLPVVDLREAGTGQGEGQWEGDTLIVDTPCLDASPLRGMSLHEACNMLIGGHAHTGEDRIAATLFDDAECERAAGFLPRPGDGGDVRIPGGGLGIILRCAVPAEPS